MLQYKNTCYNCTELNTNNDKINLWGHDLLGMQFKYLFSSGSRQKVGISNTKRWLNICAYWVRGHPDRWMDGQDAQLVSSLANFLGLPLVVADVCDSVVHFVSPHTLWFFRCRSSCSHFWISLHHSRRHGQSFCEKRLTLSARERRRSIRDAPCHQTRQLQHQPLGLVHLFGSTTFRMCCTR